MQAALETVELPVAKHTFRTRAGGVTPDRIFNRKSGVASYELFALFFADVFAIFFETREGIVTGTPCLFNHLRKFGLEMHVGSGTTASKTEAMCYSMSTGSNEDGDTTPFTVSGPGVENPGFAGFTKE